MAFAGTGEDFDDKDKKFEFSDADIEKLLKQDEFDRRFGKRASEDRDRRLRDAGFDEKQIDDINSGRANRPTSPFVKAPPLTKKPKDVVVHKTHDTTKQEFEVKVPQTVKAKFQNPIDPSDFESLMANNIKMQAEQLNSSLEAGFGVDPKAAARAVRLQSRTGLPIQLISENMDEIEAELLKGDIDTEDFIKNSPIAAKWILDHEFHAGLTKDDIPSIKNLEKLMRRPKHLWPMPEKYLLEMAKRSADRRIKIEKAGIPIVQQFTKQQLADELKKGQELSETSPLFGLLKIGTTVLDDKLGKGLTKEARDKKIAELSPKILEEEIAKLRSEENFISQFGEVGFLEQMSKRYDENPDFMLPFISGLKDIDRLSRLWTATQAVEQGKATPLQQDMLFRYSRLTSVAARRGQDWLGLSASIMAETPAIVGEFATTGGIYTGVKGATLKTGKEIIKNRLHGAINKVLRNRVSASILGVGAQSLVGGLPTTIEKALTDMRAHGAIVRNNEGEYKFNVVPGTGKSFTAVLPEALFFSFTEFASERVGGAAVFKVLDSKLNHILFDWWAKAGSGRTVKLFRDTLQKGGIHGVIGEMGEERFGNLLRATAGMEELDLIPSGKQLAAEALAFSIMPMGAVALSQLGPVVDVTNLTTIESLAKQVKKTGLLEKSPEAAKDLLKKVATDTGNTHVYVDNEEWNLHYNQLGIDPREAAKEVMGSSQAYDEATQNKTDIAVPVEEFYTSLAQNEENVDLVKKFRNEPIEIEQGELVAAIQEEFERLDARNKVEAPLDESSEKIGNKIFDQLVGTGIVENQAYQYSQLYEAAYRTLAKRTGKTPEELFDLLPLTIARPAPSAKEIKVKKFKKEAQVTVTPKKGKAFIETVRGNSKKDINAKLEARFPGATFNVGKIQSLKSRIFKQRKNEFSDLFNKAKDDLSVEDVKELAEFDGDLESVLTPEEIERGRINKQRVNDLIRGVEPTKDSREFLQERDDLGFFSTLRNAAVNLKQNKGTPEQMLNAIKKQPGIKQEEIEWTGLGEFLKADSARHEGKVTKDEIVDFLDKNGVEIELTEVGDEITPEIEFEKFGNALIVKGGSPANQITDLGNGKFQLKLGSGIRENFDTLEEAKDSLRDVAERNAPQTKFGEYRLEGDATNYREVLLRLPEEQEQLVFTDENVTPLEEGAPEATDPDRFWYFRVPGNVFQILKSKFATRKLAKEHIIENKQPEAPVSEGFTGGHFDEPNVIAHMRIDDRVDSDGNKVLFINEIQSDWHQDGRKEGYRLHLPPDLEARVRALGLEDMDQISQLAIRDAGGSKELAREWFEFVRSNGIVPNAPFKKNAWAELSIKRAITMAAEGGYKKIAWTTGEQQTDLYDLSKQVSKVTARRNKDGLWSVQPFNLDGRGIPATAEMLDITDEKLEGVVGKDLAEKMIAADKDPNAKRGENDFLEFSGLDLKVGGEGMKAFYDKLLPNLFKKTAKKLDKNAKVEDIEIEVAEAPGRLRFMVLDPDGQEFDAFPTLEGAQEAAANETRIDIERGTKESEAQFTVVDQRDPEFTPVHSLEITDEMIQGVAERGQSLFQDKQKSALGRILLSSTGGSNKALIELFEKADESTFLHETGHFYLELLTNIASAEDAPQDVKDDLDTVLKWLGVDSAAKIGTKEHEQFARGFEAYLRKGKAPSTALAKAFRTFKRWLGDVYKSITELNVTLTKDVTDVMDRMLATQEEIDARAIEQNVVPKFSNPEVVEESIAVANEQMMAVLMKELRKEEEVEFKKVKAQIRTETADEIEAQPVYQVREALTGGEVMADGRPMKLSRQGVIDQIGVERSNKFKGMLADDGMHQEELAAMYGYADGTTLIADMETASPKNELIDEITDERISIVEDEFFTNEEKMRELSRDEMHSDRRVELLLDQLKALGRLAGRDTPTKKLINAQARIFVGKKSRSELRPHLYLRAEAKAVKRAHEAALAEDVETAYQETLTEILNHELYRESKKAIEDVDKSVKRWGKFLGRTDESIAKTRDIDLVNAARAILAQFGLGETDKQPSEFLNGMKQVGDLNQYEELLNLVNSATQGAADLRDVIYDEFVEMQTAVDSLLDLSLRNQQMLIEGKKEDRKQMAAEVVESLNAMAKDKPLYKKTSGKWSGAKMRLLGLKAGIRRIESWVSVFDGGDSRGNLRKVMFTPISDASVDFRSQKKDAFEKLREIIKPLKEIPKEAKNKILVKELGTEFTNGKADIIGAILHTGNDSNKSKLLRGYDWGTVNEDGVLDTSRWDKFFQRMIDEGTITQADMDVVQEIWDLMEEFKPLAWKAHKEMYGYAPKDISADSFSVTFPDGKTKKYRGGYVPAKTDPTIVTNVSSEQERELLENGQNSYAFPTTGRGATKGRNEMYARELSLNLAMLPSHFDWLLRFSILEPRIKDAMRIINDPDVKEAIDGLDSKIRDGMIVPWLQRSARQKSSIESNHAFFKYLDPIARTLRRRSGLALMTLNVGNILQQPTGLSISAVKVKPKYLRNALFEYVKNPKKMARDVTEMSKFMDDRVTPQAAELMSEMDSIMFDTSPLATAEEFFIKHGLIGQQITQSLVDHITWTGAYDQATENGFDHKEAVREADSVVRLTQGDFAPENISNFEAGTETARMFTQFTSYFNMQANLQATELTRNFREMGLKAGAGKLMYVHILGFMIPAFFGELIVTALAGEFDDEDDDGYLDEVTQLYFWSQIRTATAMVPFVGSVAQSGINQFNDKWFDDRINTAPAIRVLESSVRLPFSVYKAISESGKSGRAIKDALTALSISTGIPFQALAKPAGFLSDLEEGNVEATDEIDFVRGLLSGRGSR